MPPQCKEQCKLEIKERFRNLLNLLTTVPQLGPRMVRTLLRLVNKPSHNQHRYPDAVVDAPVPFAKRGIQGPPNIDAMGNVNTSTDDAMQAAMQANVDTSDPSLIDRGIASAGNVMDMIRNAIPDARGYASSPGEAKSQFTKSFLGPALQVDPQKLAASLQDDPNINVIPDFEVASSVSYTGQ